MCDEDYSFGFFYDFLPLSVETIGRKMFEIVLILIKKNLKWSIDALKLV